MLRLLFRDNFKKAKDKQGHSNYVVPKEYIICVPLAVITKSQYNTK